ncbi:MAG: NnrS family protein [Opitutales bacterium]
MTENKAIPPTYRQLIAAGEPFRLLFPLGVVFALLGLALWPAFAWGLFPDYPGIPHARVMLHGFMAAFIMGFLGTALPRLLDVPRVRGREVSLYALGLALSTGLHLAGLTVGGDAAFLLTFGGFLVALLSRARQRQDTPPPGFVLVLLGLLCGFVGTTLLLIPQAWSYAAGRLLLYQGFLVLPVMGVGAFLLPRFFQLPSRQNFPESLKPPPGWWPRAFFALTCGALIFLSFAFEIAGALTAGHLLRAAAVLLYFWREVPAHQAKFNIGTLAGTLRLSLLAIPLGLLATALMPAHQIGLLHIVYLTGFGLLTLTVATRVIFGHCGQSHRFKFRLPAIIAMAALFFVALALRLWGEFALAERFTLYAFASLLWIAGLLVWAIRVLPHVREPDTE